MSQERFATGQELEHVLVGSSVATEDLHERASVLSSLEAVVALHE